MPDARTLDSLGNKRLIFVAGKGGTGKTTVVAALALAASKQGKRVLAIEIDAKGDLMRALGHPAVGFRPKVVHPNISALSIHPEESIREYLHLFFRVPGFALHTPLARVFDFIATGVPGPKDLVIIGKVTYEVRRRDKEGGPYWDMVIVDCAPTGQILAQLLAAHSMRALVKSGVIAKHAEWVDETVRNETTALCIVATPEEMPVAEAVELHDGAKRGGIPLGVCFLNRTFDLKLSKPEIQTLERLEREMPASRHELAKFREGLELGDSLTRNGSDFTTALQKKLRIPLVNIPFLVAPQGLATTKAIVAEWQPRRQTAP